MDKRKYPDFRPETRAWEARVSRRGGALSRQDMTAGETIVRASVSCGLSVGNSRVNLFAGNNLAACMTPVFTACGGDADTGHSILEGAFSRGTGLALDGATSYLSWGNIGACAFRSTSAHQLVYRVSNGLGLDLTSADSSDSRMSLYISAGETDCFNTTTGRLSFSAVNPVRLCGSSRTAANSFTYYEDGQPIASSATGGGTVPASSLTYLGSNEGINLFSNCVYGGYSLGPGLTVGQVTVLSAAWQEAMTILGRAV